MKESKKKIDEIRNTSSCSDCAREAGGVFKKEYECTMSLGTCPICKKDDSTLIPWVDYNWPKLKTNFMWD